MNNISNPSNDLPIYSQHRYRLLGGSLIALHAGVIFIDDSALRVALMLIHCGILLLWQPIMDNKLRLDIGKTCAIIAVAAILAASSNPLAVTIWLLLLAGLLGGEHAPKRADNIAQALSICCVFLILLLEVSPLLFQIRALSYDATLAVQGLIFFPALLLFFIPASQPESSRLRVDYIRSLSIVLFGVLLSMAPILWSYRFGTPYTQSLVQTLLFTGLLILGVNWIWKSKTNHSFLQLLWNRYLLSLGSPLEYYLLKLSGKELSVLGADEYLEAALQELKKLDWVAGIAWSTDQGLERIIGRRTHHQTGVDAKEVSLTLYTDKELGPTFVLHIQLLVRLTELFFVSKKHEAQLKRHSHLQAIYETGSRLTHDIKNILQSLQSVTAITQDCSPDDSTDAFLLLKRQLPEIQKRLQLTLEKLKRPNFESGALENADRWWKSLKNRYLGKNIVFIDSRSFDLRIPTELFDSIADNLIENATYKQSLNRDIVVSVSLSLVGGRIFFSVTDTGDAMSDEMAKELFAGNVKSVRGLGVGLFHCYQLAQRYGYNLELKNNQDGDVCFALSGQG